MAKFVNIEFKHELKGPYVMFKTTANIKLEQAELGKKWKLEIVIVEKDRATPDDIFQDENWARIFTANKADISVELHTPVLKRDLSTELGQEEVFAKLKIIDPDGASTIAEATTEIVKIKI